MKKLLYIALFTVLGVLVSTLLHAGIEIPLLAMMENQVMTGDSFLADHWWLIHGLGGQLLWLAGAVVGFILGRKFWQILYVEKRYGIPRW